MESRVVGDGLESFGSSRRDEILLLRGLGTSVDQYFPLIELLVQKYCVLVTSMSKMKGLPAQPGSIDEYIERLIMIKDHNGLSPRYGLGHSLGGHLVLRDVVCFERAVSISPIVPVKHGAAKYFLQALEQAVKMSTTSPDPSRGRSIAFGIADKCARNLRQIIRFANSLDSAVYSFAPSYPVLAVEAVNDEFFPPKPETRYVFEHKNIVHHIVERNHSWPLFYPQEVYDIVNAFVKKNFKPSNNQSFVL